MKRPETRSAEETAQAAADAQRPELRVQALLIDIARRLRGVASVEPLTYEQGIAMIRMSLSGDSGHADMLFHNLRNNNLMHAPGGIQPEADASVRHQLIEWFGEAAVTDGRASWNVMEERLRQIATDAK